MPDQTPPYTNDPPTQTVKDDSTPASLDAGEAMAWIGPYRLLQKLGEGGMGEVWLAEQSDPMRRRVAVKVIKAGMDTKAVVARFDAERQAIALMEHPTIARVFDAGETPQGRPYFVMEHVQGVPITDYCDQNRLTTRERLALFVQVCDGVKHAHQKAIIHRDIKPSNVLVIVQDGVAVPKIIDFGVAKATAQRLTEKTLFTELGAMIGTPEYMSPEQAEMSGEGVDTRTDVYALGVMLYELLVGALPFDPAGFREAGFVEIVRKIREDEPPKPSARLSALGDDSERSAQRRRVDVRTLRGQLRGDLDWITMRALEKQRARRYGSPSELAEDIRRHLRLEPVLAHAPSTGYRAWKFVRRHRLAVAAASIVVLTLAAGAAGSTIGLVRARRAEAQALREAKTKGRVAEFLKGLFKVSDPSEARGNAITARELLDRAAGTIDKDLSDRPEVRAEMASIMGEVYDSLGLYVPAEGLIEKALEIRRRVLGPESPDTLGSMADLAHVYFSQGRYPEAEDLYRRIVEARTRLLGPENPATVAVMSNLAIVYWTQGRLSDAERLHSQVLDIETRAQAPNDTERVKTMNNLANVYQNQGRNPEAERMYSQTLEIEKRLLGPEHPDTLVPMNNLAIVYAAEGRYLESRRLHSEVLAIRRRVFGPTHPDTLVSLYNLACVCAVSGDRVAAMDWLRQSVDGGYVDFDGLAQDGDLTSLHGPEFDALIAKARKNAAAQIAGGPLGAS